MSAIILAILIIPQNKKVEIITDSVNCIETFDRITSQDAKRTLRRWMKEKNWSLWMHLMEILRRKKLKLNLKKIKAHNGNKFNEIANSLAKEDRESSEILWKDPKNPIWFALPTWNQIIIDRSTRDFLKEFHKIETTTKWTQQNRMIERWSHEIKNYKNYSWNSFWKQCRQENTL